jgi:hypothetical protein
MVVRLAVPRSAPIAPRLGFSLPRLTAGRKATAKRGGRVAKNLQRNDRDLDWSGDPLGHILMR